MTIARIAMLSSALIAGAYTLSLSEHSTLSNGASSFAARGFAIGAICAGVMFIASSQSRWKWSMMLVVVPVALSVIGDLTLMIPAAKLIRGIFNRPRPMQMSPTRRSIAEIALAVDVYEVDCDEYPQSLNDLIVRSDDPRWNGPYLKGGVIPVDAWGHPLQFELRDTAYVIRSAGADGVLETRDDIRN